VFWLRIFLNPEVSAWLLLYKPVLRSKFVLDHFVQFFFMNVVEESKMKILIFKIWILNFLKGAASVYVFEEYFQMVIIRIRDWHWWLERMDRQRAPSRIEWSTASDVSDVGVHRRAHHGSRSHGQKQGSWVMWRLQFGANTFSPSLPAGRGRDISHY